MTEIRAQQTGAELKVRPLEGCLLSVLTGFSLVVSGLSRFSPLYTGFMQQTTRKQDNFCFYNPKYDSLEATPAIR